MVLEGGQDVKETIKDGINRSYLLGFHYVKDDLIGIVAIKKPMDYKELYNKYLINKTDEIAYEKNMRSIRKFLIECNKVLFSRFEYKNKLFPEPDDDVTLGLFALIL